MKVTIEIETESNDLGLTHALLADIIRKSSRAYSDDEIEHETSLQDDNCGFEWTCIITPDE